MEEKIRINLLKETYETLLNDMESFEFRNRKGEINKNAFFNQLIINYVDIYRNQQLDILNGIEENLKSLSLSEIEKKELSQKLLQSVNNTVISNSGKKDMFISFRPTKQSENIINQIQYYELNGASRSSYFRSMFESYINLPKDERERIIFKDFVEKIDEAINTGRRITILTKNTKRNIDSGIMDKRKIKGMVVDPFKLVQTKEEMHNYLVVQLSKYKATRSYRLNNIYSISILPEPISFDPKCKLLLQKMSESSPQFNYEKDDAEFIQVRLTEQGERDFKKFYVHRPTPTNIENHVYTFECPKTQFMSYFKRLGKEAIIIYPKEYATEMLEFHKQAVEEYLK